MYRRYISTLLVVVVLSAAAMAGIDYVVDPLLVFRVSRIFKPILSTQQRYQNPGLARNYPSPGILLGTSMAVNFSPRQIRDVLGLDLIKLTVYGGTAHELAVTAQAALDAGRVKEVIWMIEPWQFRGAVNRVRDDYGPFPYYLYEKNNYLGWLKYYILNADTLGRSLRVAAETMLGHVPPLEQQLEHAYEAEGATNVVYARSVVVEDYKRLVAADIAKKENAHNDYDIALLKSSSEENFLKIIRSHPEVKFTIIIPPYSLAQHKLYRDCVPEVFENMLAWKRFVLESGVPLQNAAFYDFQEDIDISGNLDLYHDLVNYKSWLNDWIIDKVKNGYGRVQKEQINPNIELLRSQVTHFSVE